jgi:hypothetical protein
VLLLLPIILRSEVGLTPNHQAEEPGYHISSGLLYLTRPTRETLPVATLSPALFSGSFDHASPTATSK